MNAESLRPVPRSVPPQVSSFEACIRVLSWVEQLPLNETGALTFEDGLVLVERQRVCWAIAGDMGLYLTDLLCEMEDPRISRTQIEAVYRRCRKSGERLSDALLENGLVSEQRLRAALREHNCEAIVRLSRESARPRFRPLARGYDDRFSLTTTEVLAAVGERTGYRRARAANSELELALVEGSTGVAFSQDSPYLPPTLIATGGGCALPVGQVLGMCRWAFELLSLGATVNQRTLLASATWGSVTSVVTWRLDDLGFAALCQHRVASTLLLDRLARRHVRPTFEGRAQ
jgi:hypothetical protein